ncbi:SHQ1 protein-domain-containing protein [Blyttiomyces helicus]|uniref:SHQ1 protein-domain-containing protein n=1 Tax=Blyttiomyces helicus TaxID=388810 RepID=A0A4V1IRM1_9FUNG|nr:SHQ1 protein-domain-containing protein [Blyttiomyces helicus]|eukprot:RKO90537.1 SHQ1 protein-domain-containing protein [Blyttiomyces helicus]
MLAALPELGHSKREACNPLVEDGREKATYDVASGEITVLLPKATPGLHFPDLDLLTKLMATKGGPVPEPGAGVRGPLIQEMDAPAEGGADGMRVEDSDDEEEEFNWETPQSLPKSLTGARYGFNNAYSGFSAHVTELAKDVLDITDVDTSTPETRRQDRIEREEMKFDEDYYMGDFMNDEEIMRLRKFKPATWTALKKIQKARLNEPALKPLPEESSNPSVAFTEKELEQMRKLPNKSFLIDDERSIYLGLVDIIFAYCYNHRTTEGENTVESAWTICKLSSTLSALETFSTLRETLTAGARRALCYPLYRHFGLVERVIEDVAVVFKLGRRALLRALLEVKELVEKDEACYVLGKLYLEDYCVWVQKASDKTVRSLATELNHVKLLRSEVGFPLEELEKLARECGVEEEGE